MMYAIGLVLLALGILVSVALHECGHMWVARATGMKVRRYFVGFGPTLWSTKRPNKLGYTEYGVKAVPLGGFCDIAGMTAVDEIAPEDEPYAMYKQKVWKRVAVLFAGPAMNFIVGLVVIYGIANVWGLPDLNGATNAEVKETSCVAPQLSAGGEMATCQGPGPAGLAGLRPGDRVVAIDGKKVTNSEDMVKVVRDLRGPQVFDVVRDGEAQKVTVDIQETQRWAKDADKPITVGAIGATLTTYVPPSTQYNALTAVPGTIAFTGDLSVKLGEAVVKIPAKMGALVRSLAGGERDPETPISVVGASRLGGEAVEADLWVLFWFLLAQLNFVLGAVNLLPLIPFDGGHIAVAWYERVRDTLRKARGRVPAGPVNYMKLMPAAYAVIAVVGVFTVLTVAADLINPVSLFQ
jgi:membrane-associated protease RseP (regulator of RpoE activity)